MNMRWLQMRGEQTIRQFLCSQSRMNNEIDNHVDRVLETVEQLLRGRGIFHAKIHFTSGQLTLWSMADPYNYQVYVKDEFLAPHYIKAFASFSYPLNAIIPPRRIGEILQIIRALRNRDDAIYLRSCSLNIMNGRIGLVFSCGSRYYIDYADFLRYREDEWESEKIFPDN